jgi:hypothetical protein
MASPSQFHERKAPNALRAAGLRQATSLRDRVITRFAKQKRMRRQGRLGGEKACSKRLIDTLLHQVISKVSNVSHDQHPALSG